MAQLHSPPPRSLVVICDGTWCGSATGFTSNLKILADSFAGQSILNTKEQPHIAHNKQTNTTVRYFDGVGMAGSFSDYLVDAALATSIKERCVEAYQYIVQEYEPGTKVWLFGFSRGAHTVRSVAGMINNLGILRKEAFPEDDPPKNPLEKDSRLKTACDQVYSIYRNPDETYRPGRAFSLKFKDHFSHATTEPPIIFMGLLDTVGALGVPKINPGVKFSYDLYDTVISTEVQHVCQALALHDRMGLFEPCFARRLPMGTKRRYPDAAYTTHEVWFPGSHYDIGRQRFVFCRDTGTVERYARKVLLHTNILKTNVTYTKELSDNVFDWMVARAQDVNHSILPLPAAEYRDLYANDALPLLWNLPWMGPLKKDAYDAAYEGLAVRLLRHFIVGAALRTLLDGKQRTYASVEQETDIIKEDLLLADREIPLPLPKDDGSPPRSSAVVKAVQDAGDSQEAKANHDVYENGNHVKEAPTHPGTLPVTFFCRNSKRGEYLDGYRSKAFEHWQLLSLREAEWVDVPYA